MKRILVPTDFSTYAEEALRYAIGLAQKTGAEILLLHVCELLHSPFADRALLINEYNDRKTSELTQRLETLKEALNDKDVRITAKLYDGDVTDSILQVTEQEKIDLIVMGTLGATGLDTVFFGTKTAAVIAKTVIPVITIPFNYRWKTPERFLVVCNDPQEDIRLFDPVFQLVNYFKARISIAVFSEEKAHADELMNHSRFINDIHEQLKKRHPESDLVLQHLSGRDFYQALQQYAQAEKIDLLVMTTHKRNLLQQLFKFSMTRQMSYHTTIPLLALHSARTL